jgi:hypothetical protein
MTGWAIARHRHWDHTAKKAVVVMVVMMMVVMVKLGQLKCRRLFCTRRVISPQGHNRVGNRLEQIAVAGRGGRLASLGRRPCLGAAYGREGRRSSQQAGDFLVHLVLPNSPKR